MKKLFMVLVMAFTLCSSIPAYTQVVLTEKQAQKAAKKKAKELSKQKWEYSGIGDLESMLFSYYMTLKEYGGKYESSDEMLNGVQSIRKGQKIMLNDAQAKHAQMMSSNMQTTADGVTGESMSDVDINKYSSRATANFFGDVKEAFVLVRKNKNGTYDMKGYYLVDMNSSLAKKRALDNDIEMSEKISKSIREEDNEK